MADELWVSCKPGSITEIHPKNMVYSVPMGNRPSVTFEEYQSAALRVMGYKAPTTPTLVVPSLRWECAGMYTVYVLCCYLTYLLAAI
jgi:hypothetical protein